MATDAMALLERVPRAVAIDDPKLQEALELFDQLSRCLARVSRDLEL